MLFLELKVFNMRTNEHGHVVGRIVPFGLSWHVVVDGATVNFQALERDVLDLSFLVISVDDGKVGLLSIVAYVAERDVLYSAAWCFTIFLIPTHLHLHDTALVHVLDTNVVKQDIPNQIVVAALDGQAALIVHLGSALANDVDVLVGQVLHRVAQLGMRSGCSAVEANEDGMCHIGPKRGVGHANVSHRTREAFACGVGCRTVVAVAAEDAVLEDVVTTAKDVQPIAPTGI